MGRRLDLQTLLEGLTSNVYFQPPATVTMSYPCIVYKRDYAISKFAGNKPYHHTKRYMVTVIDQDPDSVILDKVADLPQCLFLRHYTADNLNHDIYKLYF